MRHWLIRLAQVAGWLLAAMALAAGALAVAEDPPKGPEKPAARPALAIIFSNDMEGYLEPCG